MLDKEKLAAPTRLRIKQILVSAPVLPLAFPCDASQGCSLKNQVITPLCPRWNPDHSCSLLRQSSLCWDQDPFRK